MMQSMTPPLPPRPPEDPIETAKSASAALALNDKIERLAQIVALMSDRISQLEKRTPLL